jgi:hypothetical protein
VVSVDVEQVQLFRGELKDGGASVFVFKGIHYVAEGRPFSEIVFPMRVRACTPDPPSPMQR